MEAYFIEWAALLLRWLHVVAAVAWIGASFYFVWLDQSLEKPGPELSAKGGDGELWAVHGGGFYNPQKYLVAPRSLPENLHWFYWESYVTWMSGFALFTIIYLTQPQAYLVDPRVMSLSSPTAVALALGFLIMGWVVYDLICRAFPTRQKIVGALTAALIVLSTLALARLFSGRATYLLVGAMMATMMSANVFFWIIPGQKKVIKAMREGQPVDPLHGQRGKMRSVHNTYFTLPVIFCMLSNHFSHLYAHRHAGWILILMMAGSVLIRQFFLNRHKGIVNYWYPSIGSGFIVAVMLWVMPMGGGSSSGSLPSVDGHRPEKADVNASTQASFSIVQQRCYGCHALKPTLMGGGAPKGIAFETPEDLKKHADLVYQQSVTLKIMPLGNLTKMTDEERQILAQWYEVQKTKQQ